MKKQNDMETLEKLLYDAYLKVDDSSIQVETHKDCPEIGDTTIRVYHDGGYSFKIREIDNIEEDKYDYVFVNGEDEFKSCDEKLALRLLDETRKSFQLEQIKANLIVAFKCPNCDSITEGEEIEDLYNDGVRFKIMNNMKGVFCESCYSDSEVQNSSL